MRYKHFFKQEGKGDYRFNKEKYKFQFFNLILYYLGFLFCINGDIK